MIFLYNIFLFFQLQFVQNQESKSNVQICFTTLMSLWVRDPFKMLSDVSGPEWSGESALSFQTFGRGLSKRKEYSAGCLLISSSLSSTTFSRRQELSNIHLDYLFEQDR